MIFIVCCSRPLFAQQVLAQQVVAQQIDLAQYNPSSPIKVAHAGDALTVDWQGADKVDYQLVLDISGKNPLMKSISYAHPYAENGASSFTILAQNIQPDFPVTIGSRGKSRGNSLSKKEWPYIFFDTPNKRPSKSFSSRIDLKSVNVSSEGSRV